MALLNSFGTFPELKLKLISLATGPDKISTPNFHAAVGILSIPVALEFLSPLIILAAAPAETYLN